jgi:hypothetical protein
VIRTVFFLAFIGIHGYTLAQRSKPKWDKHPIVTTTSGDSVFLFNTVEKKEFQPSSEKKYYWFNNGAIGSAQGGVTGKLLQGDFTCKSNKQGLIEKGKFDHGLKIGWWLRWHGNGSLKSKVFWKAGFKEGVFYSYSLEGNLKSKGYYKNNLLHGVLVEYGESNQVIQTRYYNGKIVPPKVIQESIIKKTESEKKLKAKKEKVPKKAKGKARLDSLDVIVVPEKKQEVIKQEVINDNNEKRDHSRDSIATPVVNEPKKKVRIPLSERIKKNQ